MRSSLLFVILTIMVFAASTINARAQEEQTINFDDLTAPCDFASALPLRDEYSSVGIHFIG